MSNRFNFRCPRCGSADHIDIIAFVSVRLTSTGTDGDCSDCGPDDWTGENAASCEACDFFGTVKDFEPGANVVELFGTRNKKSG